MAARTKIEWTDATWNPITGCSVVSPGCTNCYAMKLAGGRLRNHPSRTGLTAPSKAGPVWNGRVRLNEEWLDLPHRWRRPRKIFVCAHGDLFHENVPLEWIKSIWEVMHHAHRQRGHIFQILTKRPEWIARALGPDGIGWYAVEGPVPCPEPGIWLGTSIENQKWADIRVPFLLNAPAAVRFVSAEPLLGPIDLTDVTAATATGPEQWDCLDRIDAADAEPGSPSTVIDWVIVGGESGPGARPMRPDWARSLRDQCQAAGTAFHFKQWGAWAPVSVGINSPSSWDGTALRQIGKKRAGRELDGRTWEEYPA